MRDLTGIDELEPFVDQWAETGNYDTICHYTRLPLSRMDGFHMRQSTPRPLAAWQQEPMYEYIGLCQLSSRSPERYINPLEITNFQSYWERAIERQQKRNYQEMVARTGGRELSFEKEGFWVDYPDDRRSYFPYALYPRLASATMKERRNHTLSETGAHWPDLGEVLLWDRPPLEKTENTLNKWLASYRPKA